MPHPENRSQAIVLLSGGLDSSVALAVTLQHYQVPFALLFNYGQRAWALEQRAAHAVANALAVRVVEVDLPWLANLLPQALTAKHRLTQPEAPVTEESLFETRRVWVPNRNGVFLNIAAAYAEAHEADVIVFGANADEAVGFPDNTQEYRDALNVSFEYSTLRKVRVETPVGTMTKAEIVAKGLELGVPLAAIWSCYEGDAVQCGQCPSCLLLKRALSAQAAPVGVAFSQ